MLTSYIAINTYKSTSHMRPENMRRCPRLCYQSPLILSLVPQADQTNGADSVYTYCPSVVSGRRQVDVCRWQNETSPRICQPHTPHAGRSLGIGGFGPARVPSRAGKRLISTASISIILYHMECSCQRGGHWSECVKPRAWKHLTQFCKGSSKKSSF